MPTWLLVAFVAGAAALLVTGHFAARQVRRGRHRWVWLVRPWLLITPVLFVWGAWQTFETSLVAGLILVAFAILYGAAVYAMFHRMSARLSTTPPGADLFDAMAKPIEDFEVSIIGVTLIAGVIAVVVLIGVGVWIVLNQ